MDPDPLRLTVDAQLGQLELSAARFAEVIATGDLCAGVPGCPGWDLHALADHLGETHRWARGAVVEGHPRTAMPGGPAGRDELVGWYRRAAAELLSTLRAVSPDAACWTFGPHPRQVRFWIRRQAHETAMHRRDAEASQGVAGTIDAALSADGIDEVLTMLVPRQIRLGRLELPAASVALEASDGNGRWVVGAEGAEQVGSVRGSAQDLLLMLWRRRAAGDSGLEVSGEIATVRAVLAAPLTP